MEEIGHPRRSNSNKRLVRLIDPVEDDRFDWASGAGRQKAQIEADGKLIAERSAAQQDGDRAL
jgi:hypothetical protein